MRSIGRQKILVYTGILVSSVMLLTIAVRGETRKFAISNIECHVVSCVASKGMQEGLGTLEVSGKGFQQSAGRSLVFTVSRHSATGKDEPVLERKVGVFSDGHLTASIPAYQLSDGVYNFTFRTGADSTYFLVTGTFQRTTGPDGPSRPISQNTLDPVKKPPFPSGEPGGAAGELAGT